MYKNEIANLINQLIDHSKLSIETDVVVSGHAPTMASSQFLINKEQGDWAEDIVFEAISQFSSEFFPVRYGRADSLTAGEAGFSEFYAGYQEELNSIGKKPDLLIFKKEDFPTSEVDTQCDSYVKKAVAALEIRSSSFLSGKYSQFMTNRQQTAINKCIEIKDRITSGEMGDLLKSKNSVIYNYLNDATAETFKELDFRRPSWSSSEDLRNLTDQLKELKKNIKILQSRDYLSITPKLEDIALVNRWIQNYNVKHFYLQVFFDKAYVVSFKKILELASNPSNEGTHFSIERDVKNQGKTTIKVNIRVGKELLGRIDMPEHKSVMKELDRGRLLFYVSFKGGRGYLDQEAFRREVVNA